MAKLRSAADIGLADDIRACRSEGLTFPPIAARLNAQGHRTRRDRPWNPTRVRRVLDRIQPAG
jgi:hypothetical protein